MRVCMPGRKLDCGGLLEDTIGTSSKVAVASSSVEGNWIGNWEALLGGDAKTIGPGDAGVVGEVVEGVLRAESVLEIEMFGISFPFKSG